MATMTMLMLMVERSLNNRGGMTTSPEPLATSDPWTLAFINETTTPAANSVNLLGIAMDGGGNDDTNVTAANNNSNNNGNGTYVTTTATDIVALKGIEWWTSVVYPMSGYTPLGLLITSIFVTIIMIMIVGGNTLVIIAIATERSLKGIQNWFIASLAVADCLLGLIIMPFSLANEMMGYWVFGQWWCDVHSAVDVLLCTSSIMNLCLISLDRYWSITHAIEYLRKRTPERVVIMIAIVWLLSGLISIPPLLGWKKDTPPGEFPKCVLSEDIGYVLYSALGSFYIPSCIMVFVYIRIYFAARARARRAQANKIKRRQSNNSKQQHEEQSAKTIDKGKLKSKTVATTTTGSSNAAIAGMDDSVAGLVNGKAVVKVVVPIMEEEDEEGNEDNAQEDLETKDCGGGGGGGGGRGAVEGDELDMHVVRRFNSLGAIVSVGAADEETMQTLKNLRLLTPTAVAVGRRIDATISVSLDHLTTKSAISYRPTRYATTAPNSLTSINEIATTVCRNKPAPNSPTPQQQQQQQRHGHCITFRDSSPPSIGHQVVNYTPTTYMGKIGNNDVVHHNISQQQPQQMRVMVNNVALTNNCPELELDPLLIRSKVEPKKVTINKGASVKILKDKAPQQPLSRRASLLFGPSGRRKFEILARRFAGAGNGGVGAEEFVLKPPQRPNTLHIVPDTCQSELRPDTEWSTSSFPSSPSGTTKHRDERDAMLVEVEETTLVNPANVEIDFNDGSSAASASPEGSNAPTCEIQRKFSNARLSNVRVGQLSSSNSGPGLAGQAGTGDMENPSEMDPSSSDSGTMARCTVVRPLKIRFCRPSSAGSVKKSSKAKRQVIDTGRVVVKEKDPARERKRLNRQREKRATLILGLIMGAFIACWLPFFFLYLLAPVCQSCNIQPWGFAFAFWLGYINSALNPVIYTIFNKDFRKAFKRIIFRCTIANY